MSIWNNGGEGGGGGRRRTERWGVDKNSNGELGKWDG